ncbi:MAG: hypothetical protein KGY61_00975 [Desulfobacterales bacterium]|nr:hypothetical protein [Desulfobacterales bacterium]
METLWTIIANGIHHIQAWLLKIISPLHIFGPVLTIAVIAALTVFLARFLTRRFKTRRYKILEREFYYWYDIKQQALKLKAADPEKARELGINIDKGKLNEAYYNYFFEGLLNNLLTIYMPIFSMLAFVNDTYRPKALEAMFGQSCLFRLPWVDGSTYPVGSAFWFVICVIGAYAVFFGFHSLRKRYGKRYPIGGRRPENSF